MDTNRGLLFLLLAVIALATAQENAQTRIPESLLECYQDPLLMQRDYRLPSTMDMLIDLVRKAENNAYGYNMDMRNLVISLIHRFRLDGIVKAKNIAATSNFLPFGPKGYQFYKHKILLTNLLPGSAQQFPNASLTSIERNNILQEVQYSPNGYQFYKLKVLLTNFLPGSAQQFPNASLTAVERCTLHHMLSSTIERNVRGDEGTVCSKLSQYRTQRLPRQLRTNSDVEVMNPDIVNKINTMGQMRLAAEPDEDASLDVLPGSYASGLETPKSQCPVEDGVVYTKWGAVSVGPLLAGIAAGLQPQKVPLRNLVGSATGNLSSLVVDNKHAATLAGDLAEVALRQGPIKNKQYSMGSGGGWNSTQAPKWYFLSQSGDHELTDAEIRGGLDGLILANNIDKFISKSPSMKLSQLLDMYYSQRGVFSESIRACNRKALMTEVASTDTLLDQVLAFSYVLDKNMQLQGTIIESGFREYSTDTVQSLNGYIPSGFNDLSCAASATTDINGQVESSTDIYVVLDTTWSYSSIYPSLTYLFDNLNVSPIGSNVTLLSGKEGKIIVNSTSSLATLQQLYNESVHQLVPAGLDIPKVATAIKDLQKSALNNESSTNWAGGKSAIVLVIAGSSIVSEADVTYSTQQLRVMNDEIPDLRFLYVASSAKERFNLLVKDPVKDIFTLTISGTENSASQINDVIKRIKDVPRRLINHRCTANWKAATTGNSVHYGFVTPGSVNFYRLAPNYFFNSGEKAGVKIQGMGYGPITVCHSRTVELPRATSSNNNGTSGNDVVICVPATSNTVEISLKDACSGQEFIHKCGPLYISVEASPATDTTQNARCTERDCRYPDSIKFTVNLEELGCYSGAKQIMLNMSLLLISFTIMFKSLFL